MQPKLITRIFGGLGNQLFCYAAARRLTLNNNIELVIDNVSGFIYDHDFNRHYQLRHFSIPCREATSAERMEPISRVRRYLKRRWNKLMPFEQRRYLVQEGVDFDPRLLQLKPNGTVYLEGYWQSEAYFKDIEATIRQDLKIIPPTDIININMAAKIVSVRAVAVHVRFFDMPHEHSTSNASGDYYKDALNTMEHLVPGAHYFIFSDQPAAARAKINIPDNRVTLVSHNQGDKNAFADLWLMTLCQHFIIANSTFSWWGAWLSDNKEKHVIAPRITINNGQSSWGFDGLIPHEWIKR